MILHDSPCGDTSNAATVAITTGDVQLLTKAKKKIFQISSETTHVVTATVAVFDVSPHGLWRNVKYRSSQTAREMEMVREMIRSSETSQCAFEFLVANIT